MFIYNAIQGLGAIHFACVCLNKILGADTQLRKARKQTCKDKQRNVRGLAEMFTIKNKLYHIMTGKVN